ncbi:MAG: ATP-binding protein [Deltaproteobacteria bacterium]|nr:ATP-binding protein [Deltaproteobacteria bacterium]
MKSAGILHRCDENKIALRKPETATLAACLLLAVYIGFLMLWIYNSRMALGESIVNRYRLDVEKQVASIGYFFSERKYDVRAMAASREIATYFLNKTLGMSEQYGLKVNLFIISQMLNNTLKDKTIHGDRIYERLLLMDKSGNPLVDTSPNQNVDAAFFFQKSQTAQSRDPEVFVNQVDGNTYILICAPCSHRDQMVGTLMVWIDVVTILTHLVNFLPDTLPNAYHLTTVLGQPICPPGKADCLRIDALTPERIQQLPMTRFESIPDFLPLSPKQSILMIRQLIPNMPLQLLAWMPESEIYGALSPWQILMGMGSLALVILLGIGVLFRFNTRHLILITRFDESERQQNLLSLKNQQLEVEILRRREVENELEVQRTLRMRSDRLRSLGEMAAGIAHELNQPLLGVRGLAELVLMTMGNDQNPMSDQNRKNIGRIVEQADRMVHIINHVRMFAREAGKTDTSRVDLNEVVRSGVSLLTAQFKSHGLHLELEMTPCSLPIQVNPYSIEEVILNLLSNSRDALEKKLLQPPPGYLPMVWISTEMDRTGAAPVVRLSIRDNGNGIPDGIAEKIFDPFFTTKDPDKGTGLGLSICKSIVEEFDGHIQFTSTEGVSSAFEIDFPACLPEESIDVQDKNLKNPDRR